jgi:hypothetical protein
MQEACALHQHPLSVRAYCLVASQLVARLGPFENTLKGVLAAEVKLQYVEPATDPGSISSAIRQQFVSFFSFVKEFTFFVTP